MMTHGKDYKPAKPAAKKESKNIKKIRAEISKKLMGGLKKK